MKKLFGVALVAAALGIAGCEDRGTDRGDLKREVKELPPGEQTNRERVEKAGEEVEEAGRETKRQAREGSRELRRDLDKDGERK
jgi:hypothetical protein